MDRQGKKLLGVSYLISVVFFLSFPSVRETPELWVATFLISFPAMLMVAIALGAIIEIIKALEKWIMK
jgi:hypothetical protein